LLTFKPEHPRLRRKRVNSAAPDFVAHDLPPGLPSGREGLKAVCLSAAVSNFEQIATSKERMCQVPPRRRQPMKMKLIAAAAE